MKKYAGRIILIAACIVVAVYYLFPTWRDYDLRQQMKNLTGDDSLQFVAKHETEIRDARARRIKLGLDLQGGMRVVLEVNVLKLVEDLAKNKDDVFFQIMKEVRAEARTSEESPVLLLRRKFEARQIRMSRYYRNLSDTNDDILQIPRGRVDKGDRQGDGDRQEPRRPVRRVRAFDSETGRDQDHRRAPRRHAGKPRSGSSSREQRCWNSSC